jgi:hypothetical protein
VYDACGRFSVIAKNKADEWRCGVVDGNHAKWIAIKEAMINKMHCVRETDERPRSCGVCDMWLSTWTYWNTATIENSVVVGGTAVVVRGKVS